MKFLHLIIMAAMFAIPATSATAQHNLQIEKQIPTTSSFFLDQSATALEQALNIDSDDGNIQTDEATKKRISNNFYNDCMSKPQLHTPNRLKKERAQMLCTCAASALSQEFSANDMRALFEKSKDGKFQRNRMIAFVYTPCLETPISNLVAQNCSGNAATRKNLRHYSQVCACLGERMGADLSRPHRQINYNRLNAMDKHLDIHQYFQNTIESKGFKNYARRHLKSCIKTHEFGQ